VIPVEDTASGRAPLRKARTRAAIIEAATALFAERGYDATSIHQVAARADTGVGTLYNYFDSKEEILRHVLIRQFEGAETAFAQITAARSDPRERLQLALDMYANYVRQNRRLIAALFGVTLRGEGDIDGPWRDRLFGAFRPLVRDAIEASGAEGRDPEVTTRVLLSTYTVSLLGIGIWRDLEGDAAALASTLQTVVDNLLGQREPVAAH
jgi:AcrR family transcriptional regulator